jgi:CBS domain-containing protein
MLGAGLGTAVSIMFPGSDPLLWPLVCMAAVLAGVLGAPLTAAVFALGLTGDFNALLPLLLATGVSYGFTVMVMRRSIMTEKIARRGLHIYREYSVDPQERVFVHEVMTADVMSIPASLQLEDAGAKYFGSDQRHRAFPVVDGNGATLGMLDRSLLQAAMSRSPGTTVGALFEQGGDYALPTESCQTVARRMAALHVERLPVVSDMNKRHLLGIISRSDLVKPTGISFLEEHVRERMLGKRKRPAS